MTIKRNTFEGGADGVDVTSANVGGTLIKGTGAVVKFAASAAILGATGVAIQTSPSGRTSITDTPDASNLTMSRVTAISLPNPLPSGSNKPTIWWLTTSSGIIARILVDSTGLVQLQRSSGALITLATGRSAGEYLLVSVWLKADTSTTGEIHMKLNSALTGAAVGTAFDSTNSDLGSAAIISGDVGVSGALSESYLINVDHDVFDDGRASFIPVMLCAITPGPSLPGVQRTATLTLVNGNGNAVTWGSDGGSNTAGADWGDGGTKEPVTTTAAGVTTKTYTRTPSAGGLGKLFSCPWSQA